MTSQRMQAVPRAAIPEFNGVIVVAACEQWFGRAKGNDTDSIGIALERFPALSGVEVPKLDRMVAATAH